MSKKKTETTQRDSEPASDSSKSWREAIESIVIAIVLAFLFRAFEAEAFVIPTGSMAPTLQGRHKDMVCPECEYRYRTGASADAEVREGEVVATTCPMCFYTKQLSRSEPDHFSHTGDRILVNKFAYEAPFGKPERWDVIVFKYPGNAKQNYIKRLVGLPGETIKIRYGDIYVQGADGEEFEIARKPPRKLTHMLQLVHDTRYLSPDLTRSSWPAQWQAESEDSGWASEDDGHTFVRKPKTEGPDWLRFRMYPLDFQTWGYIKNQLAEGKEDLGGIDPEPVLITDFYAYNAQSRPLMYQKGRFAHPFPIGMHWVGDLAVEAEVKVVSDSGKLLFDLVEAGRHYTCAIELETGVATLSIDDGNVSFDGDVKHPTAKTRVDGKGRYDIRFSNVDDELLLWVNNRVVTFDEATTFKSEDDPHPVTSDEDPGDLAPIGIGVDGAELRVNRLRVLRDIYYIATTTNVGSTTDYHFDSPELIASELSDPEAWKRVDNLFSRRNEVVFKMEEGQFFPLGDNSPYSRDGRLWGNEHYVDRDLLIGKAIVIYWPHAWRVTIPFSGMSIPLIPNVRRMGLIH